MACPVGPPRPAPGEGLNKPALLTFTVGFAACSKAEPIERNLDCKVEEISSLGHFSWVASRESRYCMQDQKSRSVLLLSLLPHQGHANFPEALVLVELENPHQHYCFGTMFS